MIESVLEEFNLRTDCKSICLGNAGGFSGSNIWKITSHLRGDFCLKQWPRQFQDDSRIEWIHKVLVFAAANGCPEIVQPLESRNGHTFVAHAGTFWELCRWADGNPIESGNLTPEKLDSVIDVLARFHQATARYFFNFTTSTQITKVRDQLLNIRTRIEEIEACRQQSPFISEQAWSKFKTNAPSIAMDVARFLLPYSPTIFPVQPVIKDIRPEHIFFTGDDVTAIIDFGAMNIDNVACDLARLLGGMFDDDAASFNDGIDNYAQHRPIYPHEREVILPLNHASVVLGITNWLRWLIVDQRKFDSTNCVQQRLNHMVRRFENYI